MGGVERKPGEDFGKFKPTTTCSIAYFPLRNKRRDSSSAGLSTYFGACKFSRRSILKRTEVQARISFVLVYPGTILEISTEILYAFRGLCGIINVVEVSV
jgi:hypothetical protein